MILPILIAAAIRTPQAPNADPKDVGTEDAIIKAVYDVISGPAGEKRNWDRFRSLFDEKGTLCAVVKNRAGRWVAVNMTPEDYVSKSGPYLEKNGFFERETKRQVMRSGMITTVHSSYESRKKLDDKKPFEKGVNAIQLFTDGRRWYVHSILWQGG